MSDLVFGDDYSANYDRLYGTKDYDGECALALEAIRRFSEHPVKSLGDWGCGTGGHSIRFAQQGYEVIGVDLSGAMLTEARRKAEAAEVADRIALHEGDVMTTPLGAEVDASVMMFAVLGYQTTNDRVLETLRNVRRHLKTGGVFVADVWYGPAVLTERPGDRIRLLREGETEILRAASTSLDTTAQVATVTFDLWSHQGSQLVSRTTESHGMRYFFAQELALFLSLTGFELISLTEFPSLEKPASDKSWNVLIVARAN